MGRRWTIKYKILASITIIATTIALVAGATMAWFTDNVDIPEASFTAGTVEIRAGQTVKAGEGIIDFHDYLNKAAEENEIVEIYAKQGPAGALRKTESIRMIR